MNEVVPLSFIIVQCVQLSVPCNLPAFTAVARDIVDRFRWSLWRTECHAIYLHANLYSVYARRFPAVLWSCTGVNGIAAVNSVAFVVALPTVTGGNVKNAGEDR